MAALLVSILVLFLEDGTPAQAIVGGTEVKPGKYHFMVQLLDPSRGNTASKRFFCGGTMIDPDSVLTAAHCFRGMTNKQVRHLYVRIGSTKLGRGAKRGVLRVWIHGGFNLNPNSNDNKYDVAVITLRKLWYDCGQQCKPGDFVAIPNPDQNQLEKPETLATEAGWGWTQRGTGPVSPVLREAHVTLRSDEYGESAYGQRFARALMIAAGSQKRGAEHGDSGGPLLVHTGPGTYYEIGIASFTDSNPNRRFVCDYTNLLKCPDVYTEVNRPSIYNFILSAS
jgi:trypsin